MKFVPVIVSVIAVFTADSDSRIFPDISDADPDIADNVTPPSGGYSPGEIVEHFPEELENNKDGEKSENIYEIIQTYTGVFTDEPQNFPINSVDSQVDQQFKKERNGFNTPELRGKKQDKIIKQLVKDLADIKYNLTHANSDLKEELQIIRDHQDNFTDIGKGLKVEIQSIKDDQSNFNSVGSEIKVQLQSLKESQNNFTGIGTNLQSAIGNIKSSNSLIISKLDSILANQWCPKGFFKFSSQCFKYLNDTNRKWTDADVKCRSLGLTLAQPTDPVGLRKYMMTNFVTKDTWLGGRGTGSSIKWLRGGQVISSSLSYWYPGMPGSKLSSSYCLDLMAHSGALKSQPSKPYYSWGCTSATWALCEKV